MSSSGNCEVYFAIAAKDKLIERLKSLGAFSESTIAGIEQRIAEVSQSPTSETKSPRPFCSWPGPTFVYQNSHVVVDFFCAYGNQTNPAHQTLEIADVTVRRYRPTLKG